jgi:transposase
MGKKDKTYDYEIINLRKHVDTLTFKEIEYHRKFEEQGKEIEGLRRALQELGLKYEILEEQHRLLKYKYWGGLSEKWTPEGQLELFNEAEMEAAKAKEEEETAAQEEETVKVAEHTRKKRAKGCGKKLPENLRRVEVINDIPEEEKVCEEGWELVKIGEDVSERLEITEPEIYVKRTITPKYARRRIKAVETGQEDKEDKLEGIIQAKAAATIVPGGMVGASLLSHILRGKYLDMLPYYRQERGFERLGVDISRQDMSNWQIKAGDKLEPLYDLLKEALKRGRVLRMDETMVQVMGEKGRKNTCNSYMWLARGGPEGERAVIYKYDIDHPTREAKNIYEFLSGYKGYLQTDGYGGYDSAVELYNEVTHVGCFAHVRRKFIEAQKAGKDKKSAQIALNYIRDLYEIENRLRAELLRKEISGEEFVKKRKEEAWPALEKFYKWLKPKVAADKKDKTLLDKAVNYTFGQWAKLERYLEDAELTPDNNLSENAIRPFVIGRKNWMFYGCPEGAKSGCVIYSLLETAKANGVNPNTWFTYILEKAPLAASPKDWAALLPWNAKASLPAYGHC